MTSNIAGFCLSDEFACQLLILIGKVLLMVSQFARHQPLQNRCFTYLDDEENCEFLATADCLIEFFIGEITNILDVIVSHCPSNIKEDSGDLFRRFEEIFGSSNVAKDAADLLDRKLIKVIFVLILRAAANSENW